MMEQQPLSAADVGAVMRANYGYGMPMMYPAMGMGGFGGGFGFGGDFLSILLLFYTTLMHKNHAFPCI